MSSSSLQGSAGANSELKQYTALCCESGEAAGLVVLRGEYEYVHFHVPEGGPNMEYNIIFPRMFHL